MKNVGSEKPMKAKRIGDLVEDRVGPGRRIDADRQGDQQSQNLRRADHEQRRRQALQDQYIHIHAAGERKPQSPSQHRHEPAQVAQRDRVVEPKLLRARRRPPRPGHWGWWRARRTGRRGARRQHGERALMLIPSRLGIAISNRLSRYRLTRSRSSIPVVHVPDRSGQTAANSMARPHDGPGV